MSDKKMGRPTNNPKPIRMGIRMDLNTLERLDEYCRKNNITRSDAVRIAINSLLNPK